MCFFWIDLLLDVILDPYDLFIGVFMDAFTLSTNVRLGTDVIGLLICDILHLIYFLLLLR